MSEYIFHFGRYKGQAIETVPLSYLRWCLRNVRWFEPGHQEFNRKLYELFRHHLGVTEDLPSSPKSGQTASKPLNRKIKQWYVEMSKRFHPDHGGSTRDMIVVNLCREALIEILSQPE